MINIAYGVDDNSYYLAVVSIISIIKSAAPDDKITFYILNDCLNRKKKNHFLYLKKYSSNIDIKFCDVSVGIFKEFPMAYWVNSYATYFRTYLPELLPDVEKVLYMDCDTIVKGSLRELFVTDISEMYVAAVVDLNNENQAKRVKLNGRYFNAGVLLMNLNYMRKNDFFNTFKKIALKIKNCTSADQDILNILVGDKKALLHPKYNLIGYGQVEKQNRGLVAEDLLEYEEAIKNPVICHMTGKKCPTSEVTSFFEKDWWSCAKYSNLYPYFCYTYVLSLMKKIFCQNIFSVKDIKCKNATKKQVILLGIKISVKVKKNECDVKTPFISVIVASYNYEKYIVETIESLLKQTYKKFEVIIVDDASCDNSVELIKQIIKDKSNFKLYVNEENLGLAKTLQKALNNANGDYIAFCESDDYWADGYLQEKVDYIKDNKNAKIITNNIELVGEYTSEREKYVTSCCAFLQKNNKRNISQIAYNENKILTFSSVMVSADVLKKANFNTPDAPWLDYWLWRQILFVYPVHYVNEKLTY